MTKLLLYVVAVLGFYVAASSAWAAQTLRILEAAPASAPPQVDGVANESLWRTARPLTVRDALADIPITLQAVYTDQEIAFLVQFPDPQPDLEQKTYVWDAAAGRYRTGPSREDTLVLKWAMEENVQDLTLSADWSYKADIWYWKACRTDPTGYADDKHQVYSRNRLPNTTTLLSHSGTDFYLRRSGDAGTAAYKVVIHPEYRGERVPKYRTLAPTGSRADIRAKGVWRDGSWTLELVRRLRTGHGDDVQFDPAGSYLFGVSRYEIAGRKPNPKLDKPLFGAGEVGEHLRLRFTPAP